MGLTFLVSPNFLISLLVNLEIFYIAVAEHDCRLNRSMFDVLRILRG